MKPSKYNITIDNLGEHIVYNTMNDKLMLCQPELMDLLREYRDHVDRLGEVHPSLYRYMKENRFIVPDDEDETRGLIGRMLAEDLDDTYCSVTVNPTLNCNLSCWYCYEEHRAGSRMTPEVYAAVERLIGRITANEKLKDFNLSFFGGEPLLGFKYCVEPLIRYTRAQCREHGVNLSIGFTSNAVLLTKEISDFLSSTGLPVSMQIPFDGGRGTHDTIKKTHSGEGTYDQTLANLKYAVSKGISVTVRCNYTNESVVSFESLIDELMPFYKEHPDKIRFSFNRVWQDKEQKDTETLIDRYEEKVNASGGTYYDAPADKSRCYADKRHSFVVNYNGDVYQCTAREFDEEHRDGRLLADGTIEYNEHYDKRMESRFSNPECLACYAFPICKICSQKRMELNNEKCVHANPEAEKADMVRSRILSVYKAKHRDGQCEPSNRI